MADIHLFDKQTTAIEFLEDDVTTEVFYGGGAGPGKTFLGCYWHIKRRILYPGTRGMIGRAVLKVLRESTMVSFWDVCRKCGLIQGVHYQFNSSYNTVTWFNGSVTVFMDLMYYPSDPDFHRFGSTEYTDIFVDEAPEITEKAADILSSRIRWMLVQYKLVPKMLLTGNPGDHWVKYKYVKDKKGVMIELKHYQQRVLATIADNELKEFAAMFTTQLEHMSSDYDKARLLHGDWDAVPRTGLEYFPSFSTAKHVGTIEVFNSIPRRVPKVQYMPAEPLHITYDFNVNPYITLLVAQIVWKSSLWWIRWVDEFCLPHPLNKTKAASQAFLLKYSEHNSGLFYYGDASGKSRDTRSESDQEHDFSRVEEVLWKKLSENSNRVLKSNPSIIARKNFMEDILQERLPIRMEIDDDMTESKKDMMYLKEGADGKKLKELVKDSKTGISYQKYGHTSDAMEYLICSAFWEHFEPYLKRR
jgi:phage terminase large subunit